MSGTGLAGTTAVTFGSVAALSFTTVSSTTVTAVAPSGTGTVSVTVTTAGGTSNSIAYAYLPAPVVSGISPSRGPLSGGTTVTLTGSNLTGATAVTFGSTPATSFTVVSATQITAVSPPSTAAGPATITVTTPGGTSAPGTVYFYIAAPVLTCASPGQGPVSGTNTVTLTGSGLTTTTAVTFGSTPATSFTVVSDTQLTVIAPHGAAGTVQLTVTTAGGTSDPIPYLYLPAPILTAISPGQGPVSGTNTITLTGSGLTTTTAVIFGTVPAAFTVISDSIITAVAPPGTAGPVNITVTTSAGTSPALTYTRVPPPEI
ncbi:MAG: IPT/TIG domain-containing protein [Streptomycetaceae bacterium]|nr:IPT/TIG domain-containing protein [Streptomycetaceae bacterium]